MRPLSKEIKMLPIRKVIFLEAEICLSFAIVTSHGSFEGRFEAKRNLFYVNMIDVADCG